MTMNNPKMKLRKKFRSQQHNKEYLGKNLAQEEQDLYTENHKHC